MSVLDDSGADVCEAGRYAPSPSGPLHIGNLRTALIAWLAARSRGAPFVLRIEDLDRGRCRPEHERSQLRDLAALGLQWDGPVMRQSERLPEHREAFERLRAAGRAYPCWCSRADVREAAAAPHAPAPHAGAATHEAAVHEAPAPHAGAAAREAAPPHAAASPRRYPGTCRRLSAAERRRRARETGRAPAWRLDGGGERVRFHDLLRGPCEGVVDDVVIWRADGTPAYNLAVVVDDDAQSVGEVVRGDDLIDPTPTQISIASILGVRRPAYMHVPLVLGADRRRLAKRDGAVTLPERLAAGETVAEIIAWMAGSAGLASPGEPTDLDSLLLAFERGRLVREPAVLTPGPLAR